MLALMCRMQGPKLFPVSVELVTVLIDLEFFGKSVSDSLAF